MSDTTTYGTIYLLPTPLGEGAIAHVLPEYNIEILRRLRYFVVENVRSARRFIKQCDRNIDIDALTFVELSEHTPAADVPAMLMPALTGHDIGVISEAGCPAVADPGADIVALAQMRDIPVVPLVGPSSILLSLMASGFNGQSFAFNGYMPIDNARRSATIKRALQRIASEHQTQIFIETPYRNMRLFDTLLASLPAHMRLCVACDVTCDNAYIHTHTVEQWRSMPAPDIHKRPTIFLFYN